MPEAGAWRAPPLRPWGSPETSRIIPTVFDSAIVRRCGERPLAVVLIVLLVGSIATGRAQSSRVPAGISWARIPPGQFQMGCVPSDQRCDQDEFPRHSVTLIKPIELMTTEVTVGMYRAAGLTPDDQPPWSTSPEHPVVIVTWEEAEAFCRLVSGRLPTEAEWEYAARGGREGTIYPWGDEVPTDTPGAVNGAAFEGERAFPVKSFGANPYGLFDMSGNVWEWTADGSRLYSAEVVTDPQRPGAGRTRIVRGGSFGDDPGNLRLSNRTQNQPQRVNVNVGFRCARDVVK